MRLCEVRFEELVYLVDPEWDVRYTGYRHLFSGTGSAHVPGTSWERTELTKYGLTAS